MRIPSWLALPVACWLAVSALVLTRVQQEPLQPYGVGAAHYIEHLARLDVLRAVRQAPQTGWVEAIRAADGHFPPLLHLLSLPASAAGGHHVDSVLWTGLLWLGLLALAVGLGAGAVTGDRRVAGAAATAAVLLPAAHGFASRYYYDLPMVALLWLAVAALLGLQDRRPLAAVALAALAFVAACLVKWVALLFGPPLLLGALLCRGPAGRGRRRLAVGAGLAVVAGLTLAGALALLGPGSSLGEMAGEALPWLRAEDVPAPDGAVEPPDEPVPQPGGRLGFYPLRLLTSVLGLWPALLIVGLGVAWWRAQRPAAPLVAVTLVGNGLLLLLIPPLDDRFLLPLAPVLLLPAAAGWASLELRARRTVGVLALIVGLGIAADFHLGGPELLSRPLVTLSQEPADPAAPAARLRLFALDDSVDGRGWVHRGRQQDDLPEVREQLWQALQDCRAGYLRVDPEEPLVRPGGDEHWLAWRMAFAELLEGRPPTGLLHPCQQEQPGPSVTLASVEPGVDPELPACLQPEDWRLHRVSPLAGGARDLAVWQRADRRVCTVDPEVDLFLLRPGPVTARWGDAHEQVCPHPVRRPAGCHPDVAGWPERYDVFFAQPEVEGARRPMPDCLEALRQLAAGVGTGDLPEAEPLPDGLTPDAIGDLFWRELGLDFLWAGVEQRPLEVVVKSGRPVAGPRGEAATMHELFLRDRFVGDVPATLLLPDGPVRGGVVALPGHAEGGREHLERRFGFALTEAGFAVLAISFRAWRMRTSPDEAHPEHEASVRLLCDGFSMLGLRAYEGLLGLRALAALETVPEGRLGVIGHSGGSSVGRLLLWHPRTPARAFVLDGPLSQFEVEQFGEESPEWTVGCGTHPALLRFSERLNDVCQLPGPPDRALALVPYAYAPGLEVQDDDCRAWPFGPTPEEPAPDDAEAPRWFVPFFEAELLSDSPDRG